MKFKVEDGSIDGMLLTFEDGFYFDTYAEMIAFVEGVNGLYCGTKGKQK